MEDALFQHSKLDTFFPLHMLLGQRDKSNPSDEFTPFKVFHLRRTFLVWANSHKFDKLFNEEERKTLKECENTQFKWSVGMKMFAVFCLMHLRFWKRPDARPFIWDFVLAYAGSYAMFGSNIPGVYLTWDRYSPLIQRMLESEKLKKRGLGNTFEFMD